MVPVKAEMLITHGVEPKTMAPKCAECHGTMTGHNNLMVPFTALGFHQLPTSAKGCTMCHSKKTLSWESTHDTHVRVKVKMKCWTCHSPTPKSLKSPTSTLCKTCHSLESASSADVHKKHLPKGYVCTTCHIMP